MEEEHEELDNIELYLQALRKKVDHQLKNPFQVGFVNYSFQQLNNWKNNVLQLDATSKLYGQRVDYLHSGTMQVLGSMVNIDEYSANAKKEDKALNKVPQQHDKVNPLEMYLENPQKISIQQRPYQKQNNLLWRQIMKKRDTLPMLMLNDLQPNTELMLQFEEQKQKQNVYESILNKDEAYMKMIDFHMLNQQRFSFFQQMEQTRKDTEYFMLNVGKQKKEVLRNSLDVQNWMDFDFPLKLSESKDHQIGFNDPPEFNHFGDFSQNQEAIQFLNNEDNDSDNQSIQSTISIISLYSINNSSQTLSIQKKPKKKNTNRRNDVLKKQNEQQIDFGGLIPLKSDIFMNVPEEDKIEDNFLCPKDHLQLNMFKYVPSFAKKVKQCPRRSLRRMTEGYNKESKYLDFDQGISQNEGLQTGFISNIVNGPDKRSLLKFREASLPIKELKKRIRAGTQLKAQIVFEEIKIAFRGEDPLDIFISTLHIAAEDGLLIRK